MTYKKGPASDIEIFYIQQNPDSLSVDELANKLCRTPAQVKKILEDVGSQKRSKTTKTRKDEAIIDNLMGRHKRNGKIVATVMTQAASETADATRKNRINLTRKTRDAIHNPKG